MNNNLGKLQKLGKALMTPIAVLPAAGLLLRLGAEDFLDIPLISMAGSAIFDNLAVIFALGVAMGLSSGAGAAALAGGVGYYVFTNVLSTINEEINMGVAAGILAGIIAAKLYEKYKDIKLPDYLGFFGGRRFVPIITSVVMIIAGIIFGFIWPPIQNVIHAIGQWAIGAGAIGVAVYGFLNRLLIPLGLHHVMNSFIWFGFGEFVDAAGKVVTGDIHRFFAGDPTAGMFQTGFFPIMMFGLPAACIAMIHEAKPSQRKAISGVLMSAALTSFLTGITEPIEFIFMFLAPVLYVIHAILTGISLAVTHLLGIRDGFSFSAGLVDYVLNFGIAEKPLLLIPIGLIFGIIYYIVFRYFIRKYDLATPGRIEGEITATNETKEVEITDEAANILAALGGKQNINALDACITRLRLQVSDTSKVDEEALKRAGALSVIDLGGGNMQVVVGTKAELISEEIKKIL